MTTMDNQRFVFYSDKINFKSVEGKDGKEYYVTGYISTGDVDLVNDVVTKSCMDNMLSQFKDRTIKLDFEHEAFRGKSVIETEANKTKVVLGKAIAQEVDAKGVLTTWQLNDTWKKFDEKGNVTMSFKDAWKNIEQGFYDAFSIAYVPTKTSTVNREGKNIRLLDNVNLLNVALTGNPVNPGAGMTAVMAKSLEYMKSIEEEELENIEIKSTEKTISEMNERITNLEERTAQEDKNDKRSTMENKDEEKKPDADAETPEPEAEAKAPEKTDKEENEEDEEDKPEKKSFAELKDKVNGLETEVKDLKTQNAELKAIVEKPIHKGNGAEDQEQKSQKTAEAKSVGALDAIKE